MRKLILGCGLLTGAIAVTAQAPAIRVSAKERFTPGEQAGTAAQTPAKAATPASRIDSAKEADIRQLMEVTGVSGLGEQLMTAGIAQFRASVMEARPNGPRAHQFADAFV